MQITIEELLKCGVHFGHKTERWNPKMKPFIFSSRNGIYIIDLLKTLEQLKKASEFVKEKVANGGQVIFVGTKKQAKDIIEIEAKNCNSFYINERWLGGLLTNFSTVKKTIDKLKESEAKLKNGEYDKLTKKERSMKEREIEKLSKFFSGIKDMTKLPDLMFVVDTKKHKIAINEANLMGIPIIALVDTNSDPESVTIPIPGNDDAIKSIEIVTRVISDAVNKGLMERKDFLENQKREESLQNEREKKESLDEDVDDNGEKIERIKRKKRID
ncbi:MAG: 30S ribosomal protein S2 [bacterium]|uniref:Small ribosomal subunit protein uS2 n=2 Tax=Bacteria candidate phyla TaxID=1783234 RepID=A0A124G0F2_UNCT6|nr:MAG: 30S ribosomal protein S2 [candidate division TA06 bacterium 32_111]KUK87277.1 MAG: 30S ribosomal protein S2 [candidate division TA06 bacterium 34_109]MDI6700465.1 30S ribosomal protein S2 [bacterium]HAF07589.1 30S ribosomal protein S2 [candidate division WOR-3 bacterium]HCP16140.1 30S ribosomal protein S2 [candidate division WOR-3 bacterium]